MKKIIYIALCLLLAACTKSIDITYNEAIINNNDSEVEETNSLVGVWDGKLACPGCTGKSYRYRLNIQSHNEKIASGTLKINSIPEQQYYILFNVTINIKDNSLEVISTGVIEEDTSITDVYWCEENKYLLQLSSDRTKLTGEWISSGNCDVFSNSNTIKINKQ